MSDTVEDQSGGYADSLQFDDIGIVKILCGEHDRNLKTIAREMNVTMRARGNRIMITADAEKARQARTFLQDLYFLIESGFRMQHSDVIHALKIVAHDESVHLKDVFLDTVVLSSRGRTITPKSLAQKLYVEGSAPTISCSASGRRAPAKPTLPWPWPWRRSCRKRSTASY